MPVEPRIALRGGRGEQQRRSARSLARPRKRRLAAQRADARSELYASREPREHEEREARRTRARTG